MKKLTFSIFIFGLLALVNANVNAQTIDPQEKIKKYINDAVEQVHEAESPEQKRSSLNSSLDRLITTLDRIEQLDQVPEADKKNIADLKNDFQNKKDELNGENGFTKVPANQLNEFASFVQQDFEQADRIVTISLTTALLIAIILLLL